MINLSPPQDLQGSIKWSTRWFLTWFVIVFITTWVLALKFNIDPIGWTTPEDDMNIGFVLLSTFAIIIFHTIFLHIVGKIFKIKYFLFHFNSSFYPDVWRKSSIWGKIITMLLIPEFLIIYYLMFSGQSIGGLWLLPFIHISIIYSVSRKAIVENYQKLYGKEEGEKVYEIVQQSMQPSTYIKSLSLKYFLIIIPLNLLEFVIAAITIYIVIPNSPDSWFYFLLLFFFFILQDVALLYLKDREKLTPVNVISLVFRILLFFYLLFMVLVIFSAFGDYLNHNQIYKIFNLILSIPALVALGLYIFKKTWGSFSMWRHYSIIFIVYDVFHNMVILPLFQNEPINRETLYGVFLLVPIYAVLLRYIFFSNQKKETAQVSSSNSSTK